MGAANRKRRKAKPADPQGFDQEFSEDEDIEHANSRILSAVNRCVIMEEAAIDLTNDLQSLDYITKFPGATLLEGKHFIVELNLNCWPASCPFPDEIFELVNLETLHLVGYPFKDLSEKLGNLRNLQRIEMYASQIERFPPSIGNLTKLTELNVYTSYAFHYLPYEVKRCPLKDTCMSTRVVFNNIKNRLTLPPLPELPPSSSHQLQALTSILKPSCGHIADIVSIILNYCTTFTCSNCSKQCIGNPLNIWSFERIGTDDCALLARMCSQECVDTVPQKSRCFYSTNECNVMADGEEFHSNWDYPNEVGEERFRGLNKTLVETFWGNEFPVFSSYSLKDGATAGDVREINVVFDNE